MALIFFLYDWIIRIKERAKRYLIPEIVLVRETPNSVRLERVLTSPPEQLFFDTANLPGHISSKDIKTQFILSNTAQDKKTNLQWFSKSTVALRNDWEKIMDIRGTDSKIAGYKGADEKFFSLAKAFETMRLGMTITDMGGTILYTNPAEAEMHGYEVQDLIGKDLGILAPAEFRKPMTPEQIKTMRGLRESVNIRKNGSLFPVRLISDVIKDHTGKPVAIVTTCEDITDRKRTEEAIKQRARELALLNHMNGLLQACRNEKDTYAVVSNVCRKLFPSDSGCLCIINDPQTSPNVVKFWGIPPYASCESQENNGNDPHSNQKPVGTGSLCPYQHFYPDNECLCVPITVAGEMLGILSLCFRHQNSHGFSAAYRTNDMEAKRIVLTRVAEHYALSLVNLRLRETLRIEAIRDPLTGLYNRRYMEESLKREAYRAERHNTPIGIIMLDIDHFKNFNDTYGHEVGDIVLQELGTSLQNRIRGEDIACRYGGEEFLLILPEASLETSKQRAEKLRLGVKSLKIHHEGKTLGITISLGVSVLSNHHSDIKTVLAAADKALYRAKNNGRDQVATEASEALRLRSV